MSKKTEALFIALVLLLAAWLRFRGLDWGLPYPYHPDEGSILFHSLAFGTGDLNPHWFRWPSLLMYFMFGMYGVYYALGRLVGSFGAPIDLLRSYLTDLSPFWLMGRWVSAVAGVATVWVTYRLGKRAFGALAGVIGALFLAVIYLHVRDSHYATPDVAAALLASLSLLAALRACESGRARELALSGLLAGLAASAKYPGVLAAVGTAAAYAHLAARRRMSFSWLVAAGAACAVGFVIGTPYSVLSWPEFQRDVVYQFTMVSSEGTGQIAIPFLAGLREVFHETVRRGIGYPIFAVSVIGMIWRREKAGGHGLVLTTFTLVVLLFTLLITVKRSTYLTPVLPALTALAGGGLVQASRKLVRSATPASATAAVVAVVVAAFAVVPSARFISALGVTDTRTEAKSWIEREIEPGSRIAIEPFGPELNPSERQLRTLVSADTTAVEEWKEPQRLLSEQRLEIGMTREPRYTLYGIDDRTEPFRLPDPYSDPTSLIEAIDSHRISYVVLSSKAAPWREMEGAEPPVVEGNDQFYDWLRENAVLRRRFVTSSPVPPIDMGDGRTFHSPVIEVYEMSREGGDRGVEGTPGTRERA